MDLSPGSAEEGRSPDGSLVSDYDYDLPPECIARYPADRRDQSTRSLRS